jgi:hypothetical protein
MHAYPQQQHYGKVKYTDLLDQVLLVVLLGELGAHGVEQERVELLAQLYQRMRRRLDQPPLPSCTRYQLAAEIGTYESSQRERERERESI